MTQLLRRYFHRYVQVTKPGIIMGNLIATTGGFLLASRGAIDGVLMLATLCGISLVVASGCALNNCIDRDIDSRMQRTKTRVTVTGEMSLSAALAHGVVLGIAGFALLILYTTVAAVAFAVLGFVVYVGIYSLYMKRNSVYGTLVGSLSGAVPPVVGYVAVSGQFDSGAAILLLMFCLWQMPHSYAIGIFRYEDYKAADIPVLPVAQGITKAKHHIVLYIAVYALVSLLLPITGYTGVAFFGVAAVTSLWWLFMALKGYQPQTDTVVWARKVFGYSIVNITLLSITMALDYHTLVIPVFS